MPIVYLCGTGPRVGKTALAVGLARHLRQSGHAVRYAKLTADADDPDLLFAASELGQRPDALPPSRASGAPLLATADDEILLAEGPLEHAAQVGTGDLVLLVARYRGRRTLEHIAGMGLRPSTLALNAVPEMFVERVREQVVPALEATGWSVLGVVPQERLLLGLPVRALADRLQGRWLCGEEHGDRLIARLVVAGGMLQDALLWLSSRPQHALICKGDRADLPLAGLQVGSVAIFLTEDLLPSVQVLAGARERGVPLILVRQNAVRALETVEDLFSDAAVHHAQKAAAAQALVAEHLAVDRLLDAVGRPVAASGSPGRRSRGGGP